MATIVSMQRKITALIGIKSSKYSPNRKKAYVMYYITYMYMTDINDTYHINKWKLKMDHMKIENFFINIIQFSDIRSMSCKEKA